MAAGRRRLLLPLAPSRHPCPNPSTLPQRGRSPSAPRLLEHLLDALAALRVLRQARVRLLVPLDHLLRLLLPDGLVRVVPDLESLNALLLGPVDAEEVPRVEGVDGDGPVELARGAPDEGLLP